MELMNKLAKAPQEGEQDRALLQEALSQAVVRSVLNPFTPHARFTLWQELAAVIRQRAAGRLLPTSGQWWKTPRWLSQVNGKVRVRSLLRWMPPKNRCVNAGREHLVAKYLDGVTVRAIYVPANSSIWLLAKRGCCAISGNTVVISGGAVTAGCGFRIRVALLRPRLQ